MDNKNLENPYVGIFPTREQHKTVIEIFLDRYKDDITRDNFDDINGLMDDRRLYYNLVKIINSLDGNYQKYILDLYKKLGGFTTDRKYYYFDNIEIF